MFCAHVTSSYDSTDVVLFTHRTVVWLYWWCSAHTSHRGMILLTMFCARNALALWFHGWCSVHTSHRITILPMMFWTHFQPAKKTRPKVIYFSCNTNWVKRKMNFSSFSNSGLFAPFSINRNAGNNGHVSASKRTSKFSWFPNAVKEFRERENQKQRFLFSIILLC